MPYNVRRMVEPIVAPDELRTFSVEEYHRMGEAGVFAPRERVELIRGVVRMMSPKGRRHVIAVSKATELFVLALATRATVFVHAPMPVRALESEPEPDLYVVSNPDPQSYDTADAKTELVIEVADSSLEYDRTTKAALYAEAGVPEYWIVNVVDDVVEVHREPGARGYGSRTVAGRGGELRPLAWPDVVARVDELLP